MYYQRIKDLRDYIAGLTNTKSPMPGKPRTTVDARKLFERLNTINRNRIEERMLEMLENQK